MKRLHRATIVALLVLGALAEGPRVFSQSGLVVDGYELVSDVRVTRTINQLTYRVRLTSSLSDLAGAIATATSLSPSTTIVDGQVTFGAVPAGGAVVGTDTFSVRHDRRVALDFATIAWTIVPQAGNRQPIADAGPDSTTGGIGLPVNLDGSASSDPDGTAISYHWTFSAQPGGSAATLTPATSSAPTFVPDKKGVYTALLIVDDGELASVPDLVSITVGNTAPVANAGPAQTVPFGVVRLSGDASSDADGDPLTYQWVFQSVPAGSAAALSDPTALGPTFVVDLSGTYVMRLVVNDGVVDSEPATVTISVDNSAPVANAGPDQTAGIGQTVTLDGSGSSDVDGNALSFSWTFTSRPAGSAAILDDSVAVKPTFVLDAKGRYEIQLTVNDGSVDGAPDLVVIDTVNSLPVASAGAGQTAFLESTVTLNGSGSTDADGDALTYGWSLVTVPPGSAATLSLPTAVMPTFVVDRPGTYVAQLIVNDGSGAGAPDTVTITTQNSPPIASAGPDQSVSAGRLVLLDGSPSSDVDGNPLTFQWAFTARPAGSTATLANPTTIGPSFVADVLGTYTVQLIVNDGTVNSAPDTVTVSTSNSAPVSDAGADQLDVPAGTPVSLSGLGSTDADGQALTYRWSLTRPPGSAASLGDPTSATPMLTVDVVGDYVAQLIVNDGFVDGTPDTVVIRAVSGPTANAGLDREVAAGAAVTLDGSASNDPVGRSLSYYWTLTSLPSGSTATLSGAATISPAFVADLEGSYVAQLTVVNTIGGTSTDTVTILASTTALPTVVVAAPDPNAAEAGADGGAFTFTRTGSTAAGLSVVFTIGGTATNGVDYVAIPATVTIPASETSTTIAIAPIADTSAEPAESVIVVLAAGPYTIGTSSSATVTIADDPGTGGLLNGGTISGRISAAGQTDLWTFAANAGDRIAVHVGEIVDDNDFRPWLRLLAPDGATLGNTAGTDATQIEAAATVTGTYQVLVASFDSRFDGTGTYRLTMMHTPGPILVSPGDEGGPLTNGAIHTGEIVQGDVDVWTFTATAGDRIAIHIGEMVDTDDFRPWIRLWSPSGAIHGDTAGVDAARIEAVASVTGTYFVLVASYDSGYDGTGTYRLTMTHTPGPITVSPGDEGGPLTNGAIHTGEIVQGDVDVWTFTATAGDRIAIHIGEMVDTNDFRPWIRLWSPNGAIHGDTAGVDAAQIEAVASVTGTYFLLVASYDSGYDGTGTYRLTMMHTPGPVVVSPGDQGGPLTNGAIHTGEIVQGDVDVWTFTATAGDRVAIHIGEMVDTDDFRPWIRLWSPNGSIHGDTAGVDAAQIEAVASVTGTYFVLVTSFDSGFDGTGTYRLTMTHTPGPVVVSPGDEGGPLTSGAVHSGAIAQGDVDVWTFTAAAGERIGIHIGQTSETDDFRPWIRLWGPNGAVLGNVAGIETADINLAVASVSGTYLVLVGTFDSGFNGAGTYSLSVNVTP